MKSMLFNPKIEKQVADSLISPIYTYKLNTAVTDDRSEARVDPLAALLVQGQNRQISGRGVEGNVEKAESKTETEQWVRAGGRQRGLP